MYTLDDDIDVTGKKPSYTHPNLKSPSAIS